MRVRWLRTALRARNEQVAFAAARNRKAAIRLRTEIDEQVGSLARFPYMGRPGAGETRELVIARTSWVAVYRVTADAVEIVAFWHGAQDWKR